jgi:hypothetical protein
VAHQLGADASTAPPALDAEGGFAVATRLGIRSLINPQLGRATDDAVLEPAVDDARVRKAQLGVLREVVVRDLQAEPIVAGLRVEPDQMRAESRKVRPVQPADHLRMVKDLVHDISSWPPTRANVLHLCVAA